MMVVDSSALLAVLLGEPGADRIAPLLPGTHMSAVNHCEVLTRSIDGGGTADEAQALLGRLEMVVHAFTPAQSGAAAALRVRSRHLGLSLGDRACLALAAQLRRPVLTADRAWAELDVGIDIRLMR